MDGRITDFSNTQVFEVNEQAVIINANTTLINGDASDLGFGAHLSVEGLINDNGIMQADQITIRQSADPEKSLTLNTQLSAVNTETSELTLPDRVAVIDNNTIMLDYSEKAARPIKLSDLMAGDFIRITGRTLSNGKLIALRIDRNLPTGHENQQTDGNNTSEKAAWIEFLQRYIK